MYNSYERNQFQGSLSFPFHSNFKDLSEDEEEETITIRPTSPIPPPPLIINPTKFGYKRKVIRNQELIQPTVTVDTSSDQETIQKTSIPQPNLIPFSILFSFITYVSIHLIPILDSIPNLLLKRLGTLISQMTLIIFSIVIGYTLTIHKSSLYISLASIKNSKSFPGMINLTILISTLYISKHPLRWTFNSFYFIHIQVPVLGGLVVYGMLGVIGLLSVVLVVVRSGWVAYDITEVGFNLLQIGKSGSLGGCMGKDVGSGDELGQNHDVLGQNRGDDFDKRKKDVSGEGGYSRRRRSSTISRASSNSSFRSKRSRETFNVPQSRFGIVNGDSYEYL